MNRSGAIRQQSVVWLLVAGVWMLLVAALSAQLVLAAEIPWRAAIRLSLLDWFPWLLLSPAVVWLSFQFPFERSRLSTSIPVHLAACLLAVVFSNWLSSTFPPPALDRFRREIPRPLRQQRDPAGGPVLRPGAGPPPAAPRGPGNLRRPFLNALVFRARFDVPVYWFLVSIVHAMAYYRRLEERDRRTEELEGRLAHARLEALRAQLHPHFLFNTLNAISTLVHKDPHAADEMIVDLSELLRAALDIADQEIPLRRELDFLDRYLRIQQVRFGDKLHIERETDGSALDALVPALLLQPLVENAVRHGIEPQTGTGRVQVRARRNGEFLHLVVRDNGSGSRQPDRESSGIGIANTNARLHELYGERARLTLSSSSEAGFTAEVVLPYHESTPATPGQPATAP